MPKTIEITFTLNGRPTRAEVPIGASTLTVLREQFDLTGSKLACGEGECGACTILVDGVSLNACLMFAVDCDGREVLTVEGLRGAEGPNRVQRAFAEFGAVQCGYCTPGLIMQTEYLLACGEVLDGAALRRGLEGNICRCTGYVKVLEAAAAVLDQTADETAEVNQ
ncbi:MAG: (2Fe-2S)-binding protein [Alphaproteobacteria bacterium]|jgi:carbon-monoxide dehydrogenase small subunit|nr:(2Fe-2S)-binding protein [Alphaproteobacteria bacterium]MDP6563325.1 (2Fe-2S)-binding protein [Alphaproteobacteria bacterium]MDP6814853.1 (2Fe-2S)-binding protein [Alphaproteobacteria bacterium]